MGSNIIKNFFEEIRIAKEIIENYSEFLSPKLTTQVNIEVEDGDMIKELIDEISKFYPVIRFLDNESILDDMEKKLYEKGRIDIRFQQTNKYLLINRDIISNVSYAIIFLKNIFLGKYFLQCVFKYEDLKPDMSLLESDSNKSIKIENNDNIWNNNNLPPLTKEEFYYALRLLPDYKLRHFLAENNLFEEFYPILKAGNRDLFFKSIPSESEEFYYWSILFHLITTEELGITKKIQDSFKGNKNKLKQLFYLLSKPLYQALKDYEKLKIANDVYHDEENEPINLNEALKKGINRFNNIKNAYEGMVMFVNLNDNLPTYVKDEINESYFAIKDLFNLDENKIKVPEYSEGDKIEIIKLTIAPAYPRIMELIKERRSIESNDGSTINQLNRFIKENFSISQGREDKIKNLLSDLSKWMDSIKDTKNFYAFVFLFFPRITKQGKGGDQLKLMEQRFNKNRMVWRNEPQTQEEVVDLILKYFPQFRDYKDENSYSAGAGKQREALEQLKKKPEFSWLGEWQKEIWNPKVLINMGKKG